MPFQIIEKKLKDKKKPFSSTSSKKKTKIKLKKKNWQILLLLKEFSKCYHIFHKNIRDLLHSIAAVHDDSEDKNLSWLYNYKLNELPHLSPEVNRSRTETGLQVDKIIQEATSSEPDCSNQAAKADSNTVDNPANL